MAKRLFSIIKSSQDKSRYRKQYTDLIPAISNVYVDPYFQSDFLLLAHKWKAAIVRPVTNYQQRLLEALLKTDMPWYAEFERLLSKGPFKLAVKYRPRILKVLSDAELLAYAVSTHSIHRVIGADHTKYTHRVKKKINKEMLIASVVMAVKKLANMNVMIVAPGGKMPDTLIKKRDLIFINTHEINSKVLSDYYDKMSLSGYRVMLTAVVKKYSLVSIAKEYMIDYHSYFNNQILAIIRNYPI